MCNEKSVKNKLHFKKPEIAKAEFLGCLVPILSTAMPQYAFIAAACEIHMIAIAAPFALVT